MEPKISKKAPETEQPKEAATKADASSNYYWNLVQQLPQQVVADLAVFELDDGMVLFPLDKMKRPLLNASLFFTQEALERLAEAATKHEEE